MKNLDSGLLTSSTCQLMQYRHIIWDWNGTIINDAHISFSIFNELANTHKLSTISFDEFRAQFGFPVIDFYKARGFDFQKLDFREIGRIFIERYHQLLPESPLYPDIKEIISKLKDLGLSHSVLSAHRDDMLKQSAQRCGLSEYFCVIDGLTDYYANSKTELGRAHIKKIDCPLSQIIMVGDTLHDKDTADAMGVDCALIACGYCSKERLLASGAPVFDSHQDFYDFLLAQIAKK